MQDMAEIMGQVHRGYIVNCAGFLPEIATTVRRLRMAVPTESYRFYHYQEFADYQK
jgi:hypothetical protein